MKCEWRNCGSNQYASGLCSVHYNRKIRTGTCEPGPRAHRPFSERLWSKIDKQGPNDCWNWTAKNQVSGYGKLNVGGRGSGEVLAHRAVYEEVHGPIPDAPHLHHGFVVMHTCDNRACCNPAHLTLGTQKQNVRDMDAKKRRVAVVPFGETHHKAKLTDDDVRAIRASPLSQYKLAAQYGVSRPMIGFIKRGKNWKHVT